MAEGVYAPGHLGELTQQVPFELVDAVLAETSTTQRRLRMLPSRVGVYLVLALGLFGQVSVAGVWQLMVAALSGLPGLDVACPSEKALRDLRRRVTAAPVKALFDVLVGPLAQPCTRGARYRRWRTVAFDGCSSLKAPDANRSWLGKIKHRLGWAGYPTIMLLALVETGTRGLLGAVFGPTSTGETTYARRLAGLLDPGMLVLADRGFDTNAMLRTLAGTGAQILLRAKASRRPPVLAVLADGSWLTRIAGLRLRVIDAQVTVTGTDGTTVTGAYRLLTTLTDPVADPAAALVRLYHERWEIESAFYALRHTLLDGRVLRSGDRAGIEQELWGLLVTYQVLRMAMVAAVESVGADPDRASFTVALQAARTSLTTATGILPAEEHGRVDLVGVIGRAVLAHLLPTRRARYSARKVKSPISRYHARPVEDPRPLVATSIDTVETTITEPAPQPVKTPVKALPHATEHQVAVGGEPAAQVAAAQPHPPAPGAVPTAEQVFDLLRSDPERVWRGRDVAQALGVTNMNSFCTRLSQWAHKGLLHKISRATYTLDPSPLTTTITG